jgi:hypothetical protein
MLQVSNVDIETWETMFGQLSKWVIGNGLFFKFLMEPKWWASENNFYIKWQHIYKDH